MGVVRIMEKMIDHPKFANDIHRIRHIFFIVGEVSSLASLKLEIDVGTYDLKVSDSCSRHN